MSATFVPIEELAKQFSVSPSTIRVWQRTGVLPRDTYMKIGTTYRFNADKIIAHFTQSPEKETEPEPTPAPAAEEPTQLELDFGDSTEDL